MYINAICGNFPKYNSPKTNNFKTKLMPYDSVSFTAMKKSQFQGIDLAIVEKFKAPIEKFNSNNDLQFWCKIKIEELKPDNKDYSARQDEATVQRKAILKEWFDYVINENDAYTDSISLLILNGIVQNLDCNNDNLPPVLNKGVLADTISQIDFEVKKNPKTQVNFNKLYQVNLSKISYTDLEINLNSNETGWIIIPSKNNDPDNFKKNVEKLKTLSHKNWCTKSFNAEPYLEKGDFHVYMENGKPKLGIRFIDDSYGSKILEIQGEKNNSIIPIKYFYIVAEYINKNNYNLLPRAQKEIERAQEVEKEITQIKGKLENQGTDIKTCSTKQLLNVIGIKAKADNDGLLIIDKYCQPSENYTFSDIEINEDKLFKDIKEIEGDADFSDSQVTNLGNLETVNGNANFKYSQVTDIGNLKNIGGNANFQFSKVVDLKNLKSIGGDGDFQFSKVVDLKNIESIEGNVDFYSSDVESLGKLQSIGKTAFFGNSKITDLGNLETVKGNINFFASVVKNLGNLRNVGGNVNFEDSQVSDLGNLQTIGGSAYCKNSLITDLDRLKRITKGKVFKHYPSQTL